jgi:hypothetical protein
MDVSMYFDVNSGLPLTFVLSNKIFSVLVHFSPNSLGVPTKKNKNSWTGEALETVNCFAFLKCKLTVVIRAC